MRVHDNPCYVKSLNSSIDTRARSFHPIAGRREDLLLAPY